jgi:hypothetical protein
MLPNYSLSSVSHSLNKVFLTFFMTEMFGNMENIVKHTHTHTHTHMSRFHTTYYTRARSIVKIS